MRKEDRENRKYKWAFNALFFWYASLSFIFPKMTQISREVGILGSELLIHFIGHWLNLTIVSVWCNGHKAWLSPHPPPVRFPTGLMNSIEWWLLTSLRSKCQVVVAITPNSWSLFPASLALKPRVGFPLNVQCCVCRSR